MTPAHAHERLFLAGGQAARPPCESRPELRAGRQGRRQQSERRSNSPCTAEECGWPSGAQPQNGFLDVFVPSRGERFIGSDCFEAAFLKDAE
jgi:hypothetical protein